MNFEYIFRDGNIWILNKMDGLVQDCSNSIANALELLQSSSKPLKCIWNMFLGV